MNYYRAEKVNEHITAIHSATHEILYLIEGYEKAFLIDTCTGAGNLKDFVLSLSNLPLSVIVTHGHIDHAMGAPSFETVYMNELDLPIFESMKSFEERSGYISANLGRPVPPELKATYVDPAGFHFLPLYDGERFDLGGLHISVYSLAGHTPGTMTVLVEEDKILISGDACNQATFLFDENTLPVSQYRKTLEAFNEHLKGKYERVFGMHHEMELGRDVLINVIELCDRILEGMADDIPFRFRGGTYYIAAKADRSFHREDGKSGNIIYNKERLY